MPIVLSEAAANEIKGIIKNQQLPEQETKLRVGVKGCGCSGFSYMLELTEDPAGEKDEVLDCQGIKILCDMYSLQYVDGTVIDFKNDQLAGKGFVFKNPNPTSSCGCGASTHA